MSMSTRNQPDLLNKRTPTSTNIGFDLFGFLCLVNQNCAPKASHFSTADGVCWLVTTRACKKEEEVFISYCTNLSVLPVVNRRRSLQDLGGFWYKCQPCVRGDAELSYEQESSTLYRTWKESPGSSGISRWYTFW